MPGTQTDETSQRPPITEQRPIIIIKKRVSGHGGHHGGAWKVAYADFVTAMMALFIVLWLMSSDKEIKEAIAQYFKDPTGTGKLIGTSAPGLAASPLIINKDDMSKLKEKIEQVLKTLPNFKSLKDNIELSITPDGLRIELLENEKGMFFESGKATPTDRGSELLSKLAGELGKLPNNLLIEGHTDSKPYDGENTYSNWELSTDRSNSARRLMETSGLRMGQVAQVRGFADRQLRHPDDPENPSNRRVSVIVQYLEAAATTPAANQDKAPAANPAEKGANPAQSKPEPAKAADAKPSPVKPAKPEQVLAKKR